MTRRFVALLVVTCLSVLAPLLACLPNSSMSPAEMGCCKKMAGNCDMGSGDHKCCATTVSHASPTAATTHNIFQQEFAVVVVDRANPLELTALKEGSRFLAATTSPSPPGATTVLRI